MSEIEVDEKNRYQELLDAIVDQKVKRLRKKEITLIKGQWHHHKGADVMWEPEDYFKIRFPHLFQWASNIK